MGRKLTRYEKLVGYYNDVTKISAQMHSFSKEFGPKRRDDLQLVPELDQIGSLLGKFDGQCLNTHSIGESALMRR